VKTKTMSAYQVYEQAIKPLSAEEKLTIARLIMDEAVPDTVPQAEPGFDHLKRLLPQIERISFTDQDLAAVRLPRQFGCGRDLLAGIDVDELLAVPIDDVFAEYME
jgi:hypothetical protein